MVKLLLILSLCLPVLLSDFAVAQEAKERDNVSQKKSDKKKDSKSKLKDIIAEKTGGEFPVIHEEKSLMYSKEKMGWLEEALKAKAAGEVPSVFMYRMFERPYQSAGKGNITDALVEAVTGEVDESEMEEVPVPIPAFYLKTVLYFAPHNWTVWLNDKKLTYGKNHPDVKIAEINSDGLLLIWQTKELDFIYPKWRKEYKQLDKHERLYVSKDNNVLIDSVAGNVAAKVKLNQSFEAKTMSVVEGMRKSSVKIKRQRKGMGERAEEVLEEAKKKQQHHSRIHFTFNEELYESLDPVIRPLYKALQKDE